MIFSFFDFNKEEPIYIQIEKHIKESIIRGLLQKGSKLPSTREVSEILKISRSTVVTAYENLESEGIIESIKGKGTFVNTIAKVKEEDFDIKWDSRINTYASTCEDLDIIKTELPWERGMISFKSIAPDETLFDIEEFKRAFLNTWSFQGEKILNYGYAQGYKPLIEYLLEYMANKGVDIKGKDILITNGFTEAFDILINSLTEPGDTIICENPTHNTALKIMRAHGLNIVGVDMTEEGMDLVKLENLLKSNKPKLGFIIPSYHNPTGIVMKGEHRRNVLEIFKRYSVPLIEDGFNEELLYSSSHVPPLASLCGRGNGVIYVGSLSKILFPGLRIGWILADKKLLGTLESVKRARNIHSSFLDQALLYNYMKSGAFNKYLKKVRKHYREKYSFTSAEVMKNIPNEFIMGEGGLHIFVKLKGIDSRKVLEGCYKRGVVFTPGDIFYTDGSGKDTLRIGFSKVRLEDIESGIRIIGEEVKKIADK
ncbi:PLP-dependent aminotransferase family protein [Clostridium manihotivorum]|uniref:PLP-dependent aminotransferase family protein n=1 Tax=Clostridium manihotivorum TaxID=2320868 RepID=A0A410DWC2_9CLOT|nr:PLP-dependent aminotransferase family protein [Clostridium manihotivorum]QAA33288.1 PLP-dependent aminotransferase family protein [Clostridium manihotivorum]